MILIFDLDDTLYEERTYVDSGLSAVAQWGRSHFGWNAKASFAYMSTVLDREGRGRVFDRWLDHHGELRRPLVRACVKHYRLHTPDISLPPGRRAFLQKLRRLYPLYVVTDGHKIVQSKKVAALRIAPLFDRILITHRFGIRHAKPHIYCFELIRRAEGCGWSDMVYVGDNPAKDFVNLKAIGMPTVRVLTGCHKAVAAPSSHDATYRISDLSQLEQVLRKLAGDVL